VEYFLSPILFQDEFKTKWEGVIDTLTLTSPSRGGCLYWQLTKARKHILVPFCFISPLHSGFDFTLYLYENSLVGDGDGGLVGHLLTDRAGLHKSRL
jgi:hypothetical protein